MTGVWTHYDSVVHRFTHYTMKTRPLPILTSYFSVLLMGLRIYNRLIGLVGRVFANGLGDLGSIPDHVITKTLKMVLDTSLLDTQQYKVRIKGKVEQSRERSSALPYTYWKGSLLVALNYGRQLEYADCIPCTEVSWVWHLTASDSRAPILESVKYVFIAITPKSRVVVSVHVRVPHMGQIDLFKNYSYSIGASTKNSLLIFANHLLKGLVLALIR